jgi:hypothetical protein
LRWTLGRGTHRAGWGCWSGWSGHNDKAGQHHKSQHNPKYFT